MDRPSLRDAESGLQSDELQEGFGHIRHAVAMREERLAIILETMQIVQGTRVGQPRPQSRSPLRGRALASAIGTQAELQSTSLADPLEQLRQLRGATQHHLREYEGYRDTLLQVRNDQRNLEVQLNGVFAAESSAAKSSTRDRAAASPSTPQERGSAGVAHSSVPKIAFGSQAQMDTQIPSLPSESVTQEVLRVGKNLLSRHEACLESSSTPRTTPRGGVGEKIVDADAGCPSPVTPRNGTRYLVPQDKEPFMELHKKHDEELDELLTRMTESADAVISKYKAMIEAEEVDREMMVKVNNAVKHINLGLRWLEKENVAGHRTPTASQGVAEAFFNSMHGYSSAPRLKDVVKKVMRMSNFTRKAGLAVQERDLKRKITQEKLCLAEDFRVDGEWKDFNVFEIEQSGQTALSTVFMSIWHLYSFNKICIASKHQVADLIMAIEAGYKDTAYHNRIHAAEVVASTYSFLRALSQLDGMGDYFTDIDKLVIIFAASVHDMRHPGVTNDFLVKTRNPLALRYNDISVLENFHAASAFETQKAKGVDILEHHSHSPPVSALRSRVIDMILATDMHYHKTVFESLSHEVASCASNQQISKVILEKNILHTSDISHPLRPTAIHAEFSRRCISEFFAQGDEEKKLGLQPAPLFDRDACPPFAKGQLGFINFVFLPAWKPMCSVLGAEATDQEECLKINLAHWDEQEAAEAAQKHEQTLAAEAAERQKELEIQGKMMTEFHARAEGTGIVMSMK